jgi:hypothetical protein
MVTVYVHDVPLPASFDVYDFYEAADAVSL